MTNNTIATVSVSYRFIDGYHVYTSDDVYGLYVASKDPVKAFNSIAPSIEKLVEMNDGVKCTVMTAQTYKEFIGRLQKGAVDQRRKAVRAHEPFIPIASESRQFVVGCAA